MMRFLPSYRKFSRQFIIAISILFISAILCPLSAQLPPSRPDQGNSRPPFGPRGTGNQVAPGGDESISIWMCSGCGKEVGRGITPPAIEKCPHCGVHFTNGQSPRIDPGHAPPSRPAFVPPERNVPPQTLRPPVQQQTPSVSLPERANSTSEAESSDGFYHFGIAMGIGTILVGVVILVILGMVMITRAGRGSRRQRTLHYPEERYF
jgi:hypothetical protein